jgi:AmmeMemoRadiSam system protein B
MSQIREAAVAGQFYPASRAELLTQVQKFLAAGAKSSGGKRVRALGIIAPHAGYVYSGAVAGAVFASIEIPRRVIVLCPNHTGLGEPLSITSAGSFRTPLGDAQIDSALAAALMQAFPLLR